LSGDVMEHKVHDGAIVYMALSGDMIAFCYGDCIRVINNSTCSLMILSCCFV
jgi:hypothetical protein